MSLGQTKRLMEDIPALDGSKKEWRNVGHSTQENRRSHKPSDGSESAITVSPSCFQPLADVDEEEISDDQEDFEKGELNENTEARLKTTRKAPKEPFNSTSAPTFACADGSPSTADYNSEIDRSDQTRDLPGPSS
ncbi:unnamed protein product [Brassica rapa subsp. trilocularis]